MLSLGTNKKWNLKTTVKLKIYIKKALESILKPN
jgi:hypothetical protein